MDVVETAEIIAGIFRTEYQITDSAFIFSANLRRGDEPVHLEISKERLRELHEVAFQERKHENTILYSSRDYEVLLRVHSRYNRGLLPNSGEIEQEDTVNDVSYRLGLPTDEYLIFLLHSLNDEGAEAESPTIRFFYPRLRGMLGDQDGEGVDLLDILKRGLGGLLTLRISSVKDRTLSNFQKFADASIFQFSYNLDTAIVPQQSVDELLRPGRITRNRRSRIDEIEAPQRHYNSDLVHHYQMGVAAENPSLEYLSFYHVVEHFFESIFDDDLIESVRDLITQPDFSYRRKSDIKTLITKVKKRFKYQRDNVTFDEFEALRLTLRKYIQLDKLLDKVKEYDETLVDYYNINEVRFSGGCSVNLENEDQHAELASIANRIYKTRNSIVHSKEGYSDRYIPFKHDKFLVKEVPLLRFIAELIITETSNLITS